MATCPFCMDEVVPVRDARGRSLCPGCRNTGIRQAQQAAHPLHATAPPRHGLRLAADEIVLHEATKRRGAVGTLANLGGIAMLLLGFAGLDASLRTLGDGAGWVAFGVVLVFWGGGAACFMLAQLVRHQTYLVTNLRLVRRGRFGEEMVLLDEVTAIDRVRMLGDALLVRTAEDSMMVTSVGDVGPFLDALRQAAPHVGAILDGVTHQPPDHEGAQRPKRPKRLRRERAVALVKAK